MTKLKRIFAVLIDYIIILICVFIPFIILDPKMDLILEKMYLVIFIIMILLILKDLIFKNASIGKKIFRIEVRKNDESIPNSIVIILRNIFLVLWPIEIILLIIFNKRIGDLIFKTKVVEKNK